MARAKAVDIEKMSFEALMAELEQLVERLENGGVALEDSLAAYERAMKISARLEKILSDGEKRIMQLSQDGTEAPFESEDLQ